MKVAVTEWSAVIVTVQVPVPVQSPDQPAKVLPDAGVAVSVTWVPVPKLTVHVAPQSIPAGSLVTVPVPLPPFETVSVRGEGGAVNVAVTAWFTLIVRVHAPVPVQSPDQPTKVCPATGVAVRMTTVPALKLAEHVVPQSIPGGVLVTAPLPLPALETRSVRCSVEGPENVAVTDRSELMVTVQVPVPEHSPDQPRNVWPADAVAVSVTTVPSSKFAEQVTPQSIPGGLLVTVPVPVPVFVTVSVCGPVNVATTP